MNPPSVEPAVRRPRWAAIAATAFAAALLLLALAGYVVRQGQPLPIDLAVAHVLGRPHLPEARLARVAWLFTQIGNGSTLIPLVAIVLVGLLVGRRWLTAALVLAATLSGSQVVRLVKVIVGRPRPPLDGRLVAASGMSFPSGHAADSAIVLFTLAALLSQIVRGARARIAVLLATAALVLSIGTSRIVLGVHWASDVMAGWSFGLLWALGWWAIGVWLRSRRGRKHRSA